MILLLNKRRLLLGTGGCALATLVLLCVARRALTGWVIGALLQLGGASQIRFNVTEATPWHVAVTDLSFQVRTQGFAARRVTIDRRHWWMPSLGVVRIGQARVPLTIDGSDTDPWSWPTYQNGRARVQPWQVPLEEMVVDGQVAIRAATLPPREVNVKLEARLTAQSSWEVRGQADGPGLSLQGEASYDVTRDELTFKAPAIALSLKVWENYVRWLLLLPGGAWSLEGNLTGGAAGRLAGGQLTGTGTLQLREGHANNLERAVSAAGIEADLEFTDLARLVTRPGTLRIRELRTGRLVLRELDAEFAFGDSNKIVVTRAALKALGGSLGAEPFKYFLDQRQLDVVLLAEGINVEEVLALTKDLPAKASGRVNGRLPVHVDEGGFRLGTGWLALTPGVAAQLQFSAAGLLTAGLSPGSSSYAVLQKIESGLLKLKVSELRLEIRPPDAPPGRSATLHVAGEPFDPGVKAPVTLDLNVNGPLEQLLNLGLDSRLKFGTGK